MIDLFGHSRLRASGVDKGKTLVIGRQIEITLSDATVKIEMFGLKASLLMQGEGVVSGVCTL